MACHLPQETCHDMSLVFTCSRYILKNSGIGWYGNVWGAPPSFFLRKGSVECLNILYPLVIQQLFINHGLSCFYDISEISSFSYPRKMAEDAFQCAADSAGKVPPRSRDTRNPSPDFSTLILILGFNDRQVLRGGWLKHVENSINKKMPARNVDTVVFVSLIGSTSTVDNLIQFIKQRV